MTYSYRISSWAPLAGVALLAGVVLSGCSRPVPPPAPPVPGANETGQNDPVPPHVTFTLASSAVGETRRINVHTPKDYAGSTSRYPVLYMPDGGVEEDFPHVVNTLDSLVALNRVRPHIVVGIENTERRRDMTGPTRVKSDSAIALRVGGSAAFRAFIRDELIPEIDRRYRTTGERAIIGESLVGLFIVETLLAEPGLFDRYIAFSPSLWWNDDGLLRTAPERLPALANLGRTLYLSAANEDNIAPQADTLATLIREAGVPGFTLHYDPRPHERHSTIYRAAGPAAMLRVLAR